MNITNHEELTSVRWTLADLDADAIGTLQLVFTEVDNIGKLHRGFNKIHKVYNNRYYRQQMRQHIGCVMPILIGDVL